MTIIEVCEACGAERPQWLNGSHKCPADFVRRIYTGMKSAETPEPHTAEEYFQEYLVKGRLHHTYPSFNPARVWPVR